MPPPPTPSTLDDLPLSDSQQRRFSRILRMIWESRRDRPPAAIVAHASDVLRKLLIVRSGAWVDRPQIQIGGPAGPVLRQE